MVVHKLASILSCALIAFGLGDRLAVAQSSVCSALLKDGVFDKSKVLSRDQSYEATKSYICSSSSKTIEELESFSGDASIPVGKLLADFGFDYKKSNLNESREAFCKSDSRAFASGSATDISVSKVNEGLVNAFSRCVASERGFHAWLETETDASRFSVVLKYNSSGPPYSTKITNSTLAPKDTNCVPQLVSGMMIDSAGLTLNCSRASGKSALLTVNAVNGTAKLSLPPVAPVVTPVAPPLLVKKWNSTSSVGDRPLAKVCVESGYKLISGGASVSWDELPGAVGLLMTASYPEGNCWIAEAKDHLKREKGSISVWALGIADPNDDWDVVTRYSTGSRQAHPYAVVELPEGYTMTGGGGRVNWSGAGNLLTASFPQSNSTWEVRGKDHAVASPADATAFVIGVRPRNGAKQPQREVRSYRGTLANHPTSEATLSPGYILVGGGAVANWTGAGSLLTGSYPIDVGWAAKAKDHSISDPADITTYAIGLRY